MQCWHSVCNFTLCEVLWLPILLYKFIRPNSGLWTCWYLDPSCLVLFVDFRPENSCFVVCLKWLIMITNPTEKWIKYCLCRISTILRACFFDKNLWFLLKLLILDIFTSIWRSFSAVSRERHPEGSCELLGEWFGLEKY